jgi:hypothetical protein
MKTSPPTVKLGAFMLIGAVLLAVLVHTHPEKLRAPAWVAFAGAGAFAFAGICVVALALKLDHMVRWLVCALLAGMTVVPAWIAFGSGSRQCTVISLGARSAASEIVCRGAFGLGAVILTLMFVAALRGAFGPKPAI